MLFNSLQFVIFFIIVYGLYLVLDHRLQNRMLLIASCIFYGAWDWRFLGLLFVTVVIDYAVALKIQATNEESKRRFFLSISVVSNLSILGFFKYFNFFASNLKALSVIFGLSMPLRGLHIILPVGISFYVFQSLSYTIDVYRRKLVPTENLLDFALFVTYFPQLVAGPIERAAHLLPQVLKPRKIELEPFYEGCYLIFWGFFQKVFVADNLAALVNPVFAAGPPYNGGKVLLALYAFAFQIFCDFAGYSNIARGIGKCMGFDIMVNFNLPYFSKNPREFWQRWHISLSQWLRDYLYIPLGGNRKGPVRTYINLAVTMLLAGLWHGAAWTYVIWGAYHGVLLIGHRLFETLFPEPRVPANNFFWKKLWPAIKILFFFHLVCLGWLFFRARSLDQAGQMLEALFFNFGTAHGTGLTVFARDLVFYCGLLWLAQCLQAVRGDLLAVLRSGTFARVSFYLACIYLLFVHGVTGGQEFIYFQF